MLVQLSSSNVRAVNDQDTSSWQDISAVGEHEEGSKKHGQNATKNFSLSLSVKFISATHRFALGGFGTLNLVNTEETQFAHFP